MGARSSKSELTRRKSFTTLGRSSQRSLFQKTKLKLNRINKQIDSTEVHGDVASIKSDLLETENELNGVSETVKEKNQDKYDEICRYQQNTRKKFQEKFEGDSEVTEVHEVVDVVLRSSEPHEEQRKPSVTFRETNESPEEPKRPSVKFGVQVLPPSPQQVLLKRKTYPINTSPKNDDPHRNTTDGVTHIQNGTFSKFTIRTSNSFNSENDSTKHRITQTSITRTVSLKTGSLLGIEAINKNVNELEIKLKYFTGNKDSKNYIELREGLVNNLTSLDGIETEDDSIAKQEKKILGQRISELLKILECLVEQIDEESDDQVFLKKVDDHSRVLSAVTAI